MGTPCLVIVILTPNDQKYLRCQRQPLQRPYRSYVSVCYIVMAYLNKVPQFTFEDFESFSKSNGIKHTRCAPYHPSSNGAAEHFKQALRASKKDGRTLSHRLATSANVPIYSTHHNQLNPQFTLSTARGMHSVLAPGLSTHITDKQAEPITQHYQHAKDCKFEVGQKVMVHNLWPTGPKWISGTIIKHAGPLLYICGRN